MTQIQRSGAASNRENSAEPSKAAHRAIKDSAEPSEAAHQAIEDSAEPSEAAHQTIENSAEPSEAAHRKIELCRGKSKPNQRLQWTRGKAARR